MTRAKRVDLGVMDDALIRSGRDAAVSICAACVGPGTNIAKPGRRIDDAVAVAILALPVFNQADMNHAIAGAICVPDVAIKVYCGSRWVSWLAGRRREVFTNHLSGGGIDLDDRAFGRHSDPEEVELTCGVVQLQLVRDVVNDVERVALIEVGIERVSALGEWLRLDDDRQLITRAQLSIRGGETKHICARL